MFVLNAAGQIGQHQADRRAVSARNRAKLRNFEEQNKQYLREVQLDNNAWKNEVQLQDIDQDNIYMAMVDQWSQQDMQLDKIFFQGDQNIEKAIVEMYENDYAGTQTGRTAARLAGKSAKKLGQYKSEQLHNMMFAQKEAWFNKETITADAQRKSFDAYEKIRFSPIHGHTPVQPELEAKPSTSALLLGLAGSALTSVGVGKALKAPGIGDKGGGETKLLDLDSGSSWSAAEHWTPINQYSGQSFSPGVDFWSGGTSNFPVPQPTSPPANVGLVHKPDVGIVTDSALLYDFMRV